MNWTEITAEAARRLEATRGPQPARPVRPSNLGRTILCNGSGWMEASLPDGLPDIAGPDAERGSRIHAANAAGDIWMLEDSEERDHAGDCLDILRERVLEPYYNEECEIHWEMPLRLRGSAYAFGGTADVVMIDRGREVGYIVDFKTGWGEVAPAASNPQLTAYAYMLAETEGLAYVVTGIIQPRWFPNWRMAILPEAKFFEEWMEGGCDGEGESEVGRWHTAWDAVENGWKAIGAWLREAIAAGHTADESSLVAGPEQCQYCRAKAICPEFASWADDMMEDASRAVIVTQHAALPDSPLDRLPMADYAAKLSRALALLEDVPKLVKMRDVLIDHAKALDTPPPGWAIIEKPGKRNIPAESIDLIPDALGPEITARDIYYLTKRSMSIGAIEKAYAAAYVHAHPRGDDGKKTTKKAATAYCGNLLDAAGLIDRQEPTVSLVKDEASGYWGAGQ